MRTSSTNRIAGAIFSVLFACHCNSIADEKILVPFDQAPDARGLTVRDARVTSTRIANGFALRVATLGDKEFPGLDIRAPGGKWDLTPFARVELKIKNLGKFPVEVFCRVDNPGADGFKNCVTDSVLLDPGETEWIRVALKRTSEATAGKGLFAMRGYPGSPGGRGTIDPGNVTQLVVFVMRPSSAHLFQIEDVRAAGEFVPQTALMSDIESAANLIDTFGQYRLKDWPGKTKSLGDMVKSRQQEADELTKTPRPADWNEYGGWAKGPELKATGFFRTEKHNGKWWLVDPKGRLFFSHGVNCVMMLDRTPVEGRENWFHNYPGARPDFAPFATKSFTLHGHYAKKSPACFSFAGANLRRKYGADWEKIYPEVVHQRLASWGLNTIANWSESPVQRLRKTPYTDMISSDGSPVIAGSEGYWRQLVDVFDPGFVETIRKSMSMKKGTSAGDPWCLGYFCDNEISWGEETTAAIAVLKSPAEQAAKKAFVADLKAKYKSVAALNRAWGTKHLTWEALLQSREAPDVKRARADLVAFSTKFADQYFKLVRETIKAIAPNQLYLGCRFAWVNPQAAAAAAKHCDVVTFNLYQRHVADFKFPAKVDVPLLVGEFHFGALDRGLFHAGLSPVADSEARGRAYVAYVRSALRHPQFVGCHWFQWQDQPTTGRVYDEENYHVGFIDVADTPYRETIEACREVAAGMYGVRAGK